MTMPDESRGLVPGNQPRGLSARGLTTALEIAARERANANELQLARREHPCLKKVGEEAVRLAARRPPLWEYRLYFQALADFVASESAASGQAATPPPGQPAYLDIRRSLAWIGTAQGEYMGLTRKINHLVNRQLQVAFGAPGEPGDVTAIVRLARRLAGIYRRFLEMRSEARRQSVDPMFADVMREFSKIGDRSIAEFEAYPARSLASIETALANDDGETELVLDLQLRLTADTDRFHAALDHARRRVFGW